MERINPTINISIHTHTHTHTQTYVVIFIKTTMNLKQLYNKNSEILHPKFWIQFISITTNLCQSWNRKRSSLKSNNIEGQGTHRQREKGERKRKREREGESGSEKETRAEESGPAGGEIDNQITCTHRINYQSGRDCATPTEGASRVWVRVVTHRRSTA